MIPACTCACRLGRHWIPLPGGRGRTSVRGSGMGLPRCTRAPAQCVLVRIVHHGQLHGGVAAAERARRHERPDRVRR